MSWAGLYAVPQLSSMALGAQPLRFLPEGPNWRAFPEQLALDGLARWDSGWYWSVFDQGYRFVAGKESSVAFFPAYPLAVGTLSLPLRAVMPGDQAFYLVGIVFSHAALFVALRGLERLGAELLGPQAARNAVWLLAMFPFSYFFGAAYTESMFLALMIWSFILARRGRWAGAASLALVAGATRSLGVVLGPALALEYLHQRGFDLRRLRWDGLWLGLAPLGLIAFMAFQAWKLGDPLAFVRVQEAWGHTFGSPLKELFATLDSPSVGQHTKRVTLSYLVILPLFGGLVILTAWKLGPALGLLALCLFGIPVLSGVSSGMGRYASAVFPVFLTAGCLLSGRATAALAAASLPLLTYFFFFFSHWSIPV